MREKVALWAGKDLGGIPRARKKLVSSCLPERISLKPKESGRRGKCLQSEGLRLCQAQSCAGKSQTEAMCCEGRCSWGALAGGVLARRFLCILALLERALAAGHGLVQPARDRGLPGAMPSQRISHEMRCVSCPSRGSGRGAWCQLISNSSISYRLCCLQCLRGPGFGELCGFRAPVSMPFTRDCPWCKKQFHCFSFQEMPQN